MAAKRKPLILLVDDEQVILSSVGETLRRQFGSTHHVEEALDGTEAIAILTEALEAGQEADCIISDQIMPGMSGADFLIRAAGLFPRARRIMLSGQALSVDVGQVINTVGLFRFYPKEELHRQGAGSFPALVAEALAVLA